MHLHVKALTILSVVALVALFPRPAHADNNSIANAWTAVLGQVRVQSLAAAGGSSDVGYYRVAVQANRSYAAICWFIGVDGGGINSPIVGWRTAANLDVGGGADVEPFDPNFVGDIAVVRPAGAGGVLYVRINNPNAFVVTANVMIIETTLFSPWFFVNTAAAYDAFVEIRNNTTGSVELTVRAYNAAGTIVGSTTATLAPNGNTAVSITSLGVTDTNGSVTITHNGPPGALVANITTLSGTTGLSFDAPFAPRMVWSTFQQ